jgi:hypothetical protein
MKTNVFWDVAPCSLVESDRCFRGAYCLHRQGNEWAKAARKCGLRYRSMLDRAREPMVEGGGPQASLMRRYVY